MKYTVRLKTEAMHKCCNLVGNLFYVYEDWKYNLCEKKERPKELCGAAMKSEVSVAELIMDRQTDRQT